MLHSFYFASYTNTLVSDYLLPSASMAYLKELLTLITSTLSRHSTNSSRFLLPRTKLSTWLIRPLVLLPLVYEMPDHLGAKTTLSLKKKRL